jgi:hypothetical protein
VKPRGFVLGWILLSSAACFGARGARTDTWCPAGATAKPGGSCVCSRGDLYMGACLEPTTARVLCGGNGPGSGGTCQQGACGAGEVMVLRAGGGCMASPATSPCRAEERLYRSDQGRAVCVDQAICPARQQWDGKRCAAPPECAAGTLAHNGTCAAFLDREGYVNLGVWANSAIGLDGGTGSAELCRGLLPGMLSSTFPGMRATIWLNVAINAVEQDTSRAEVSVKSSLAPLQSSAQASASAIVSSLRDTGRPSNAARVERRVSCTLPSWRWVTEPDADQQ